ncbi:pyridine nucleotide-disulphide oxidoreductase dimerisation protein [Rhodoferax ferrireducens T118]|uniref:Pyridine nucleotide-disulphide oxidoreductase dimerisation protein n=1 Tax=Albidiferax ferrireducens (strain ATCC BAA-621 / DSM 15236 / T118) TaxID=338969 RepID=Q21Y01_ALBFT|nr:bifunctional TVP38/TMEM64 family protein/FAD-dependent oxidoreductase [Rhodoferax ferrireducens]ABD69352.1 pyridine nucleotide-disulphide oxidoreductase dimerisation protein [Rhodoferax ferrireducens T118]
MKKLLILSAAALLVFGFFALDLNRYLTLDGMKASLGQFESQRAASPVVVGLVFFSVYVVVTAMSLPGAAILTLAAGALFGLSMGTLIVSFASSIGATLAFLASRYVLRDAIQRRFGDRLKVINEGMAKDGALYLFTLRLVPLFPFFLVNLLMGLTPVRTLSYYWVSQVGMLAGTLVYVNAGTQLAQINSLVGIVSPGLLLSFALLGVFPMLAKMFMRLLQGRRVYAKWQRPKKFDRNLVVIGGGAAGLVTSYIAAAVKAKVTLVEAHRMGGDCLNYGCVPSKALIKSARIANQMRHAESYGLSAAEPQFSFRKVMARVHEVIRTVEPHDSVARYTELGVEVLEGYARIVDPWTVEIKLNNGGMQRLTTRSIVIAAGASPFVPPLPGLADVGYVTSDTLWDEFAKLDAAPKRLVVLGGGPIGCELAQSFARLGSKVTQIEMAPRIMIREDLEVSDLARDSLRRDGIDVLTGHKALRCEREGTRKFIVAEHQGKEIRIEFDALLCAVGRVARLQGYGLEELGIPTQRTVAVNDYLETLYPNIYAAGDVAGPYQFTHTAGHMAWYAAVNALFGDFKRFKVDYSVVPWATFIQPEVARVGLNEQDAKEKGIAHEVTKYGLDDLDRAIADGTAYGFVKVLTVPGKDRILGVTIVGEHAGDLLAEFVLATKHGLGLNKILGTIHTYPTLAEANKYVAGEWKRAHAPQKVLALLARFHAWKRG